MRSLQVQPALLQGLIFGPTGHAMTPTHTRRRGRLYRYYVSTPVLKLNAEACPVGRVAAGTVEKAVIAQLRRLLRAPEIIVQAWLACSRESPAITETEVREALYKFDDLWRELFPAEQARIVRLLVERIDVSPTGLAIRLRLAGLTSIMTSLRAGQGTNSPASPSFPHQAFRSIPADVRSQL